MKTRPNGESKTKFHHIAPNFESVNSPISINGKTYQSITLVSLISQIVWRHMNTNYYINTIFNLVYWEFVGYFVVIFSNSHTRFPFQSMQMFFFIILMTFARINLHKFEDFWSHRTALHTMHIWTQILIVCDLWCFFLTLHRLTGWLFVWNVRGNSKSQRWYLKWL